MVSFDPYLNWLGIPPHEQPPNFYRLLGVVLFESNPEMIQQAADQQSLRVGAYQGGPEGEACQQLLSEIAMAMFTLMDPQQKAAYDGQLQQDLAQRGERAVAPPPPAWSAGQGQFGPPPPQFGPQGGMGPINPGQGMPGPMPGPMNMPGFPPPMQAPMPAAAAMPGPAGMPMPSPQPVMQMPPAMMSGSPAFAPARPRAAAPAAIPVAAPFPMATAVAATPAAQPAAPPAKPPAAPQRPIDELETLTSQPPPRRRFLKKKKTDYTAEIIIGSVVTAAGILLLVVYLAVMSQRNSKAGFGAMGDAVEKPPEKIGAKLGEEFEKERKKIEKEKQKEKEDKEKKVKEEKEKKAAIARDSASGSVSPLRPFGDGHSSSATDADAPRNAGPSSRAVDSPDTGGPIHVAPRRDFHDTTPDDIGGANDPVMGPIKP